jgi:hypothetical protein
MAGYYKKRKIEAGKADLIGKGEEFVSAEKIQQLIIPENPILG